MKRLFLTMVLLVVLAGVVVAEDRWQRQDSGLNETSFNCIVVHPKVGGLLFAGSRRSVYRSIDAGKHWKAVLNPKSAINMLLVDEREGVIYAATGRGLYQSYDDGLTWKLVYRGKDKQRNILCLAQSKSQIFLGTEGGLLTGKTDEKSWQRLDSGLPKSRILSINITDSVMYVATDQGLFKSEDAGLTFSRVLVGSKEEVDELSSEYDAENNEEFIPHSKIRYVASDKDNPEIIYLGRDDGVFQSPDGGKTWKALSRTGLLNRKINFILTLNRKLYVATGKGVYVYEQERWREIYKGRLGGEILYLAYDHLSNLLWLAGEGGVFNTILDSQDNTLRMYTDYFSHEPSIKEIQELAICYAEVEPEKISRWRKQAKYKALLPRLTVGFDRSRSDTYEIYTSSSTNYSVTGPTDRSSGWDVSVSWDLGDLIWNDDQTSIDVRSRLMVQLRNDILDEVNRTYFERRRLQIEMLNGGLDNKKRLDKELRIQELTAILDGFTGGRFSQLLVTEDKK